MRSWQSLGVHLWTSVLKLSQRGMWLSWKSFSPSHRVLKGCMGHRWVLFVCERLQTVVIFAAQLFRVPGMGPVFNVILGLFKIYSRNECLKSWSGAAHSKSHLSESHLSRYLPYSHRLYLQHCHQCRQLLIYGNVKIRLFISEVYMNNCPIVTGWLDTSLLCGPCPAGWRQNVFWPWSGDMLCSYGECWRRLVRKSFQFEEWASDWGSSL